MRLFAALEVDAETREALAVVSKRLRHAGGARFSSPENYHLTLRFFGEVDDAVAGEIRRRFRELAPPPPGDIALIGPRYFPNPRTPRVLLALAEAPPELFEYQRELERLAVSVGLPKNPKPYIPHITLARIRNPARAKTLTAAAAAEEGEWARLPVRRAALIESRLTSEGSVYTTLARTAAGSG